LKDKPNIHTPPHAKLNSLYAHTFPHYIENMVAHSKSFYNTSKMHIHVSIKGKNPTWCLCFLLDSFSFSLPSLDDCLSPSGVYPPGRTLPTICTPVCQSEVLPLLPKTQSLPVLLRWCRSWLLLRSCEEPPILFS
jgi:hypothetical protein